MLRRINQSSTVHSCPFWIIGITVFVLVLAPPVSAQKFRVRPMRIELTLLASRKTEQVVYISNRHTDKALTLDLKVVDVTQKEDANPVVIEPDSDSNTSNFDTSKLRSCLEWIKLSDPNVKVGPMSTVPVTLTIKVPGNSRGFYMAGLTVQTRPSPEARGAAVVIRYLVPILIEIQGRPMRQKIDLTDIGMEFRQQTLMARPTTLTSMSIVNQGGTFSRLRGSVTVKNFSRGHWREVTTTEIKRDVGIIPGVKLNLKTDIRRSLPSGKYKLLGNLYADGRRVKALEKDIDFAGDPSVTEVVADVALDLEPAELFINGVPGATRTATIRVDNASDDTVDIVAATAIPQILQGVAFGDLDGEELACASWVKVVPDRFTLRAGGRQNLRVIVKMPNPISMHANYYTLLVLWARYPDGMSAGKTTALVCVQNKNVESKPLAQPMKLTLAAEEESKYVIVARFGNIGNAHFKHRCTAAVTTPANETITNLLLTGKAEMWLPLEVRDFSGVLDVFDFATGTYSLMAILEYATPEGIIGQTTQGIPIRVSMEGGQRIVEIIK